MKPILIAECAKEHKGSIEIAKEMIREAKNSGFHYAKFQAYSLEDINPKHSNHKRYEECHLDIKQLKELKEYADSIDIKFFCSVFSSNLIPKLAEFTDEIKVPSTFLSNTKFVTECMRYFDTVHISTGMHSREDIIKYHTIYTYDLNVFGTDLIFYHCTSEYPVNTDECRLERLKNPEVYYSGYSDHTRGTKAMWLSWLMGAQYIEKHFSIRPFPRAWCVSKKQMLRFNKTVDHLNNLMLDKEVSEQEKENYEFYKEEFNDLCSFRK